MYSLKLKQEIEIAIKINGRKISQRKWIKKFQINFFFKRSKMENFTILFSLFYLVTAHTIFLTKKKASRKTSNNTVSKIWK